MQRYNTAHTRGVAIRCGPLAEEHVAFGFDIRVDESIVWQHSETFEERLINECALESSTTIFNQTVKDSQSTELAVSVTIFTVCERSTCEMNEAVSGLQLTVSF